MYKETETQLSVFDYVPPFSGRLDPDNRWLRLAREIDWAGMETAYSTHFAPSGKQALPLRIAFGSLIIHDALHLSDAETVALVGENPYMQCFLGADDYGESIPLSVRSMARFRRRIDQQDVDAAVLCFRRICKEQ